MKDRKLNRLQNHLMAAEENTAPKCRVYNGDSADVDMEQYCRQVDAPAKRRVGFGWLLLLLAAAAVAYLLLGGGLPWN